MCKENIDYKRLCDAIGITEGIAEELAKMECISTLVEDIYTYANYEEIAMERADRHILMEESKEFYGIRILYALEAAFFGKSKEEVAVAVSDITVE